MGSPVSVTVANLVMEDVEDRALVTTLGSGRGMWMTPVQPASCCQEFLEHLNSIETSIQFTPEKESEGKVPFLDVHLEHLSDGSISTNVLRKPHPH